ncbi:MAG TPA: TonB-dependent receptor, partial [Xanthomonadaceae bacterium]|nr:TonB-dependent receptor [Xanthomonadaceae bacterium]
LITRGPGGIVLDIFAGVQNLPGGLEVEGWDFNASYSFDSDWGAFQVVWDSAYLSYFGDLGQPDGGNVVGVYFDRNPIWRIRSNLNLDWELGDWGATVGLRHMSRLDESCFLPVLVAGRLGDPSLRGLCSNPDENQDPQFPGFGLNSIGGTTYVDAQVRWTAPWSATIAVGARNLNDKDPPVSYDTFANSFDPQYDIPGRFWYMQYTQNF